jgi:hypothetical protein
VQTALQESRVAAGDANCDGAVAVTDVGALVGAIIQPDCAGADANQDTVVTAADLPALINRLAAGSAAGP